MRAPLTDEEVSLLMSAAEDGWRATGGGWGAMRSVIRTLADADMATPGDFASPIWRALVPQGCVWPRSAEETLRRLANAGLVGCTGFTHRCCGEPNSRTARAMRAARRRKATP